MSGDVELWSADHCECAHCSGPSGPCLVCSFAAELRWADAERRLLLLALGRHPRRTPAWMREASLALVLEIDLPERCTACRVPMPRKYGDGSGRCGQCSHDAREETAR